MKKQKDNLAKLKKAWDIALVEHNTLWNVWSMLDKMLKDNDQRVHSTADAYFKAKKKAN